MKTINANSEYLVLLVLLLGCYTVIFFYLILQLQWDMDIVEARLTGIEKVFQQQQQHRVKCVCQEV